MNPEKRRRRAKRKARENRVERSKIYLFGRWVRGPGVSKLQAYKEAFPS